MKKNTLPIATIFMVLVIALAALGLGYAFWSETLTVEGTVQTGEVDVAFSTYDPVECVDTQSGPCQEEPAAKDAAAECSVAWSGPDADSNGDDGYDQLVVTVLGAYPGYHCKVSFDVSNIGSVPVHVRQPEAESGNPAWIAADFENCYADAVQLHNGESTGKCTIDIHFTNEDGLAENSDAITFGWTILAHQWNEDPVAFEVVEGYDLAAVKKGQVRYRNFKLANNGWDFAVGTEVGAVPSTFTSVDWTYSANWFFAPDTNQVAFVYDGVRLSTTVTANGVSYTSYAEYVTGNLGEVDYLQWLVRGATGQTVEFYDVVLSAGGVDYPLGSFSQTGTTMTWSISDFDDLSGGFTITGKIRLTGQSTGQEHAKVDLMVGDLP